MYKNFPILALNQTQNKMHLKILRIIYFNFLALVYLQNELIFIYLQMKKKKIIPKNAESKNKKCIYCLFFYHIFMVPFWKNFLFSLLIFYCKRFVYTIFITTYRIIYKICEDENKNRKWENAWTGNTQGDMYRCSGDMS